MEHSKQDTIFLEVETLQDVITFYERNVQHSLKMFYKYINEHTTQEWKNEHSDNIFNLLPKVDILNPRLMMKLLKQDLDIDNLDKIKLKNL